MSRKKSKAKSSRYKIWMLPIFVVETKRPDSLHLAENRAVFVLRGVTIVMCLSQNLIAWVMYSCLNLIL